MDISVVIPVLNEEENVPKLYAELKGVLNKLGKEYEIIFVDNHSQDSTLKILHELHERDSCVEYIEHRKDFGQTGSLQSGFDHAKGDIIVAMDGDLQNDPADIPKLLKKMEEGYDLVSGWRHDRKDPFLTKKVPSKFSNWLARKLTGVEIHDSGCMLKAYKKEALKGIRLYGEMHRFIPALVAWKGFTVNEIKINHRARKFGKTKYGAGRLLKGFLDLINTKFWMEYSNRPLHFFGFIGASLLLLSFIIGLYLSILNLFFQVSISDRPLLLLAILMAVLGVQFITMGFISEILIKIYYDRPSRKIYEIEETSIR